MDQNSPWQSEGVCSRCAALRIATFKREKNASTVSSACRPASRTRREKRESLIYYRLYIFCSYLKAQTAISLQREFLLVVAHCFWLCLACTWHRILHVCKGL